MLASWPDARLHAQISPTKNSDEGLRQLLEPFGKLDARRLPIGERVDRVAAQLVGTPYVGQTLETSDDVEVCTINLHGIDCVTYFETCLGIARMVALGQNSMADLIRQVTLTRYRGGILGGYLSRLHYTNEWIADNAKRGIVEDITPRIAGAVRFEKQLDFMSKHPESYRQLKANPDWIPKIAEIERGLSGALMYHVPKASIAAAESELQTGDIVAITTSIDGIDCSHTGLCHRDAEGRLRFRHASSSQKKVVLDGRLSEYVASNSKNLGVMIARPLEIPSR